MLGFDPCRRGPAPNFATGEGRMAIMLEIVGGLLLVALVIRGAMGFLDDYRKRTRDR